MIFHLIVHSITERFDHISVEALQGLRIVKLAHGNHCDHNFQAILAAFVQLHPIGQENVILKDSFSSCLIMQNVSLLKWNFFCFFVLCRCIVVVVILHLKWNFACFGVLLVVVPPHLKWNFVCW